MSEFAWIIVALLAGAGIGIAIYHYGISSLHTKLDTLIAYVKGKTGQ